VARGSRTRFRKVNGNEFVRGFLQHTLPPGFQRLRYYGFASPNSKVSLDEVKWLVWLYLGWTFWLASGYATQPEPVDRQPVRCAACGGEMRIARVVNTHCRALIEHSVEFLDSG